MIYKFDCVEINDDLDLFQIKQGTLGTFKINDIMNKLILKVKLNHFFINI